MDTKKILVAYTTNAGTTAEVAQAVGEELAKDARLYGRCKTARGSRKP